MILFFFKFRSYLFTKRVSSYSALYDTIAFRESTILIHWLLCHSVNAEYNSVLYQTTESDCPCCITQQSPTPSCIIQQSLTFPAVSHNRGWLSLLYHTTESDCPCCIILYRAEFYSAQYNTRVRLRTLSHKTKSD